MLDLLLSRTSSYLQTLQKILMTHFAFQVANELDQFRARLLVFTTQFPLLNRIFKSRTYRLLTFFIFAVSIQLTLALKFTIPFLVIGPIIFGTPHLIASFRHGFGMAPRNLFRYYRKQALATGSLWLLLAITRLIIKAHLPFEIEIFGLLLTSVLWRNQLPQLRNKILFSLLIMALFLATHFIPYILIAFLILFHHFVAFFHWIKAGYFSNEQKTALTGLIIFTLIHVLIFLGFLDHSMGFAEWDGLPSSFLDQTFYGITTDPIKIARLLVAYAFGQSVHYSLWLKIIPEQQHTSKIPTSFRQSLRLFIEDFNEKTFSISLLIILCVLAVAAFSTSIQFRSFYFYIAAFHGFFEIAGLFFKFELKTT